MLSPIFVPEIHFMNLPLFWVISFFRPVYAGMFDAGSLQLVMAFDEKGEHVLVDSKKSHLIA